MFDMSASWKKSQESNDLDYIFPNDLIKIVAFLTLFFNEADMLSLRGTTSW